jgi:hypothetical protein
MEMKKSVLTLTIAGIIALSLVLTASSALALGGPTDARFAGPAVRVVLVLGEDEDCSPQTATKSDCSGPGGVVVLSGSGTCHGEDFDINEDHSLCCVFLFSYLEDKTDIEHGYVADQDASILDLPVECLPARDIFIEGWYIQHVFSFDIDPNTGYITVDALIILVVAQ